MLRKAVSLCGALFLVGAAPALAQFPAIDLTGGQNNVSGTDGTVWSSNVTFPTGTGVYSPFLREQANGTESGFNTDANPVPLDDKEGIWTHSVHYSDLVTVNVGGTDYYSLQLDANEPNGPTDGTKSLLSLDALKIYSADTGDFASIAALEADAGTTLRYDLGGQTVYIDTRLKQGSGTDDVTVLIPTSFFGSSVGSSDFFYLYAAFGGSDLDNGLSTADGFEEWRSLQTPETAVPEPNVMLLLGGGLLGLMAVRRRKA